MQAVFLNNKTCERVHPVRIRKDNPDAEPFYEGMDEPLREIHDIWIMQYLRVDGAYFPRIAFEANEDENIEFDSNQEYEILSRKTDGIFISFRKILISIQLEIHNSFTGRMERNKKSEYMLLLCWMGKPMRKF